MFNFTHVLNASTGEKYYIDKAILENDEGYDTTPSGVNLFTIDLQPENMDSPAVTDVSLIVGNGGDWARVSQNLNPKGRYDKSGRLVVDMAEAYIIDKTLVITEAPQVKE